MWEWISDSKVFLKSFVKFFVNVRTSLKLYFFWTLAHAWILDTEVEQKSIQMLMLPWRLREHGSALSFQISSLSCGDLCLWQNGVPDIRLSGTATKKVPGKECYCFNFPWFCRFPKPFFRVSVPPLVIWLLQDMKNKRKNLFLLHILFWDQVKHKSILVSLQHYGCQIIYKL